MKFFLRKPIHYHHIDETEGIHELKRHLGAGQLTLIGIGAIIGAGIFVITGQAAAQYAGPAIVLSFLLSSLVCIFTGLCYAELSSLIPVSGGSYSYSYVAMGELPAWIVGWALSIQYIASSSTVAVGWSGYFISLLDDFGLHIPAIFSKAPLQYLATGWEVTGAIINLPAMLLVAFLAVLIIIGIKAAANFNNIMVFVKLTTIAVFIFLGIWFIRPDNWTPFIPENTGVFGNFGLSGILRAAGLLFFAYIGFDTVATLAQDAINPQKDLPKGILGSLFICTIAYIIMSLILTGVVSYTLLNVPDPLAVALNAMGPKFFWLIFIIKAAILAGLASVVLVQILGQTRVFFAISKDGLLPKRFSQVHPKSKTPVFGSIITSLLVMIISGFFPVDFLGQVVSINTLFLFAIVCLGVLILRYTHAEIKRPFTVPFVPFIPLFGIIACFGQMLFMPLITWIQLISWIILGLIIYFLFGYKNSKIRLQGRKLSKNKLY